MCIRDSPYDLFEGKNFGLQVRKVGEWNNYDLCQFVGDKMPLYINGEPVEKTEEGRVTITNYLKTGPLDLDKYEYKDWTETENEVIMKIIRNTVPDSRMISEIISTGSDSKPNTAAKAPTASTAGEEFFEQTKTSSSAPSNTENEESKPAEKTTSKKAPSLDDLYNDL